jgi:hypothetical protein
MSLVEQELLTIPEHVVHPVFCGVRLGHSSFLCSVLRIIVFPFNHCFVYPSSNYGL